jgi:hypothetical protein
MRTWGYCTTCHRFKVVRVNFGRYTGRGVLQGECDGCVDKREEQRRGPRPV